MTSPRLRALPALFAVALSLAMLSSCSSGGDDKVATQSATAGPASPTPAADPAEDPAEDPVDEATAPVGDTTSEAAAECAPEDPAAIPDGSFEGPIELKVTGEGFSGKGFSGGTGTMTITVAGGRVRSGTWSVAWNSKGGSQANGIKVDADVDGTISGTVAGLAAKPELAGKWSLDGTAVTDVAGTIPLHFTGTDTEKMEVTATGCDAVTGTFIPSFNAEASGGTSFTGTAAWTGTRAG